MLVTYERHKVMRYLKAFIQLFLTLLVLEVPVWVYSPQLIMLWGTTISAALIRGIVFAVLGALSIMLFTLFGELFFCPSTSFRATMSYIAALIAGAMLLAGMWFGLLTPT